MLKIYNSITKKKEEFKPLVKGRVGIYVCGPTVYGPPHVGHARSYINFDTVVRFFKFLNYKVKYIQNITDVGHLVGDSDDGQDKILAQALKEGTDPYEVAYNYEKIYFSCMDKLNVLRPSISSRATAFIPEMIDMIQELVDKGYGYVTKQGNVYFSVKKFKNYGQLTNRKVEESKSGERIVVASDKNAPEDFALWKAAEPEHIMKWKSPWSLGYPGWHLECSTMSRKFLGKTFDIHGGGLDNIFPHHESEIAQSEAVNECKFVNYFMHNNLITVEGTKMGKSLGNFITLPDLFKEFDPMVVRYFVLQFHYRSPIDFNKNALIAAGKKYEQLKEMVVKLQKLTNEIKQPTGEVEKIFNSVVLAMEEDFNTPVVISEILKLIKIANKTIAGDNINVAKEINYVVKNFIERVLGLAFNMELAEIENKIPSEVLVLAFERWNAKQNKDFKKADELRNKIKAMGYDIKDLQSSYEVFKI